MIIPGKTKQEKEKSREAFLSALKTDILRTPPTDAGSLSLLLLERFKLIEDSPQDARIVFASVSAVLDIHDDVGHHDGAKDSMTFHVNLFQTKDCVPGKTTSSPWDFDDEECTDN